MYEKIVTVKRTIFEAKCPTCGDTTQLDANPPKERFCSKCNEWVPFKEISYTGPELTKA